MIYIRDGTHVYILLMLLACVGEYPMQSVYLLGNNRVWKRRIKDLQEIQALLAAKKSHMKIISKIENLQGVENIDEILTYCYGVMIARGDLGVEIAAEKIPLIQNNSNQGYPDSQSRQRKVLYHPALSRFLVRLYL